MPDRDYPKPSSFQALVGRAGDYSRITAEAWDEYDKQTREWHRKRRLHAVGHVNEAADNPKRRRKRA